MLTSRACESLSELVIYTMVIFSPWAFGTTQPWSIWVMNGLGYLLGVLWVIRWIIYHFAGFQWSRWGEFQARRIMGPQWSGLALGVLTIALLGYCFISALNARATYIPSEGRFEYHRCLAWLPHSFDGRSTWLAFWTYAGLACAFWTIRDWLLGKSASEQLAEWRGTRSDPFSKDPFLPERLRGLLWVLSVSGGLLAIEGIVQRLVGSPRLLFLVKPHIHQLASSQFGTFAYRANAAEYFNLLWPVSLGFWSAIRRKPASNGGKHLWLIGSCLLMAACPVISTSRGGALICLGLLCLTGLVFLFSWLGSAHDRRIGNGERSAAGPLALFYVGAPFLGLALGWHQLQPRWESLSEGFNGRERICRIASRIAAEFPIYGTGPGTYESVSELYRPNGKGFWPAQVHNDWLETWITFGVVGSTLIGMACAIIALRWFAQSGLYVGTQFVVFLWLAFAGCLVHARFDFPFQVHSIRFLFVVLFAVLFVLSPCRNDRRSG